MSVAHTIESLVRESVPEVRFSSDAPLQELPRIGIVRWRAWFDERGCVLAINVLFDFTKPHGSIADLNDRSNQQWVEVPFIVTESDTKDSLSLKVSKATHALAIYLRGLSARAMELSRLVESQA